MKNTFALLAATILTLVGLALVLPSAAMWQALQIQAGLGNPEPLTQATVKMAGGLICLSIAWLALKATRNL